MMQSRRDNIQTLTKAMVAFIQRIESELLKRNTDLRTATNVELIIRVDGRELAKTVLKSNANKIITLN